MKKGFTLIELLVVVLIIGILAAVALPQYQKAVTKSRYVQLMTLGDSIARAEEVYYLANGKYTPDLTALDIDVSVPEGVVLGLPVKANGHAAVTVRADAMEHTVYFKYSQPIANRRECRSYNIGSYLDEVCKAITGDNTSKAGVNYSYFIFK